MASSTNSDAGAGSRAPGKAAKGAGNGRVISTLFIKTQFCRFHSMGICARGSQCKFAHTPDERQPLPDFKCTKLCPAVHCVDPSCRFAHSKDELRSGDLSRSQKPRRVDAREAVEWDDTDASLTATSPVGYSAHSMPVGLLKIVAREEHGKSKPPAAFKRTKLCKFFFAGCCLKQDDCTYAHGTQDLRPTPDLSCTKMCPRLISEGTCRNTACTYAHSKLEVRGGSLSPQDSQPVTPQRLEGLATTESDLPVAGHKPQPTQHGKQQREHKEEQHQLQQKQQAQDLQALESWAWQLSMVPQVQQWQPMLGVPSNSYIPPQPASQGLAVPLEHGNSKPPAAFRRTKLCKFFFAGGCLKQDDCPFAHGTQDLRPTPDMSCTKMCPRLISEGTCCNTACTYAHSKLEVRGGSLSPQDSQPVTPQRLEGLATTESDLPVAGHKPQPTQHGKQQRDHKEEQHQLQQKQQAQDLQALESWAWQLSMVPQVQQWQPMLGVPSKTHIPPQPASQGLAGPVSLVQVAVSPVVPAVGAPFSTPVNPVACGSQLAVAPLGIQQGGHQPRMRQGIQFPTASVAHSSEMSRDFFEQQPQPQQQQQTQQTQTQTQKRKQRQQHQRLYQTTSESDEELSMRSNVTASKSLYESSLWSRRTTSEMTDIWSLGSTPGLESGTQTPTKGSECEDLALGEEQFGIAREQMENTFQEKHLQQAIIFGDVLRVRNTFLDVFSGDTPRLNGQRRKSDPCILGRSPFFHTDEDSLGLSRPLHGTCAENAGLDAPQQ